MATTIETRVITSDDWVQEVQYLITDNEGKMVAINRKTVGNQPGATRSTWKLNGNRSSRKVCEALLAEAAEAQSAETPAQDSYQVTVTDSTTGVNHVVSVEAASHRSALKKGARQIAKQLGLSPELITNGHAFKEAPAAEEKPAFKEGDTVRRFFQSSRRLSGDTYTVVKVDERGVWITAGDNAGVKAYSVESLALVTAATVVEDGEILDPTAPEDMSILELSEEALELTGKLSHLDGWAGAPLQRRIHQLRNELATRSREELARGRWKPVEEISPVIRSRALWILDCWNGSVKKSYLDMDPANQKNFLVINQVDASDADAMHAAIVDELRKLTNS